MPRFWMCNGEQLQRDFTSAPGNGGVCIALTSASSLKEMHCQVCGHIRTYAGIHAHAHTHTHTHTHIDIDTHPTHISAHTHAAHTHTPHTHTPHTHKCTHTLPASARHTHTYTHRFLGCC
eukprot:Blabericola_migrator_1__3069@NODE_1896_length_3595_cov_19_177154_g1214_i0_p3_GENE_NODE_1896_length_3595_cov_19_177154_g1214_i0NODE_1896_length_3595_cov_19_177154_g1214_i0_p3_ORF_typecomplete_len120_score24_22Arrestin_N/PF00339_29/0_019_NODE_1896_length_3595_cov_19_177154_g1214_i013501709